MDYAGHIYKSDPKGWGKRALEWVPLSRKRKKGRPPTRWRNGKYGGTLGGEPLKIGVYGNGWWRTNMVKRNIYSAAVIYFYFRTGTTCRSQRTVAFLT